MGGIYFHDVVGLVPVSCLLSSMGGSQLPEAVQIICQMCLSISPAHTHDLQGSLTVSNTHHAQILSDFSFPLGWENPLPLVYLIG